MKELHSWARWFRALSRKIAGGGEVYLIKKAKAVEWAGRPALRQGEDRWIDPFSFLYTLAYQAKMKAFPAVYRSVHRVFALERESALPDPTNGDLWVFPMPNPMKALFHPKTEKHFDLLWRLFRQVTEDDEAIRDSDYRDVLAIRDVALNKLSHGLFLSNPYRFLPADDFGLLTGPPAHVPAIGKAHGYTDYAAACECVRRCFPGCQPFEINFLFWNSGEDGWIGGKTAIFQVNSGVDLWPDFESSNSIRPSRVASAPLLAGPRTGDVVLVRDGETHGRAVGVVTSNDFTKNGGISAQDRIHVSWINKASSNLVSGTENAAFDAAGLDSLSFRSFAGTAAYKPTFDLLKDVLLVDFDNGPKKGALNQILYGPPGTGKTWNTVALAVAIVEGKEVESVEKERKEQPDEVKRRFDLAREAGQVAMVTFHQNYAYEDFIEGIRPVVEDGADGQMAFELRRGPFRVIAEEAAGNLGESPLSGQSFGVENLIQGFLASVESGLESRVKFPINVPEETRQYFITGVRQRKDEEFTGVLLGHRGHGDGEGRRLALRVLRRDYLDFLTERIKSYKDIKPINKQAKGQVHMFARFHYGMLERLKEYHDEQRVGEPEEPVAPKNFVLILDEINRGNIARIFGELITLVEESRRIGREDETKVTLPYSGEEFGVPENLYLIGTMNTADRSIALLDTALRRRFEFVEMMPDSSRVDGEVAGVHLGSVLDAMNERIRFLRDREHQIGHTYFLGVRDLEGLRKVFQKQILPLLQEYFYDDWEKIAAVLGNNGFVESVKCPAALKGTELVEPGVKSYELLRFDDPKWGESGPYRRIYSEKVIDGQGTEEAEEKRDGADGE